jgi:hypothetical protein
MHFPKFWAKGSHDMATVWRWSDVSLEDARQQADARARELAKLFTEQGRPFDRYSYGSRPLREEIVDTRDGAVISRNLYGALVLNAERAMFVDIDFGDDPTPEHEQRALADARAWAQRHSLAMRVYRTFAGLRYLVTSATFDPKAPGTTQLLQDAGSDPLYVKLCAAQSSFRARLTPKPWRVGLRPPHERFPFESEDNEANFRTWQAGYERASARYAACKVMDEIANSPAHADVAPILELHDRMACSDHPLA